MVKKMRLLCIGDPHYKTTNRDETDEFEIKLEKVIQKCQPDLIVLLGDIYDRHETIHLSPHRRICNWIERLLTFAPIIMLVGNHDRKNNRDYLGPDHSLVPFKQWSGVTVVDKPFRLEKEGMVLGFVPYVPPGRFSEALNDYLPDWRTYAALFGHQEFRGAQMGAVCSTEGDKWKSHYPIVISGHIHDFQEIGNVIYVGTPFQQTFAEERNKTVSLFEFTPDEINHQRIKLHCRQKRIVNLNAEEVESYELLGNSLCKIKITGPLTILKHPKVQEWKKQGHLVVSRPAVTITKKETLYRPVGNFTQILEDKVERESQEIQSLYQRLYGNF